MIEALVKTVKIFKDNNIDYCVIGGLAMLLHSGRASTVDIDFYVLANELKVLSSIFKKQGLSVQKAGDYQLKAKVDDVPIDILLADHYVGKDVVTRSVEKKLGNHFVRVATPEDLIIIKSLADRSIDRRDIEELRELFGNKLDEKYIAKKLKQLRKKLGN